MKKSTLKGILLTIVVIALIASGIVIASTLERKNEKVPVGAGTSTLSRETDPKVTPTESPDLDTQDLANPVITSSNTNEPEQTPIQDTQRPEETEEPDQVEEVPEPPESTDASTQENVRDEEIEVISETQDYEAQPLEPINIAGKEYYPNPNISTLLIIGVDDRELKEFKTPRNSQMADFLVLAIFDEEKNTCSLLQIDRNTMAQVPARGWMGDYIGFRTEQINYAYTYGDGLEESSENMALAISRYLYGIPVNNYLTMSMGGIIALNDAVGGVTVTIEDDFTGVDDTLIPGETVTLMGEHAFNFVHERLRMVDNRNTERMRRQATYMTALISKVKEKMSEDESFIFNVYSSVADYILTDCDLDRLAELSDNLTTYELGEIVTPEGETINDGWTGYSEFYTDETDLQQLIAELFYIESAS